MSLDRVGEWEDFNKQVIRHIVQYCIPQYGDDRGNDQAAGFTAADCIRNMERYFNRFGKGLRGPQEELRDLLKIAHYAEMAYFKRARELGVPVLYDTDFD